MIELFLCISKAELRFSILASIPLNVAVQDPPLTSTWDNGYAWKLKSDLGIVALDQFEHTGSDRNICWCHQACLQYLHFDVNSALLVVVQDSAWLCTVPNGYVGLRASVVPSHSPSRVSYGIWQIVVGVSKAKLSSNHQVPNPAAAVAIATTTVVATNTCNLSVSPGLSEWKYW